MYATVHKLQVFQDPKYGYDEASPLCREDVHRLIALCVQKLLQDHGPVMETVRMQASFFYVMASGGFYSIICITTRSP